MAVEVGFEPTEGLPPHTLSRRAPSATRRLHRRRAYPTTGHTPHEAHAPNRVVNAAFNTRERGRCSIQHAPGEAPCARGPPSDLGTAAAREELTKQRAAFGGQHAADNLGLVIETAITNHVPQ